MTASRGGSSVPDAPPRAAKACFLEVLSPDGRLERSVAIAEGRETIGRLGTALAFPDDAQMADEHATLEFTDGAARVVERGAGSGVWLRIRGVDGRLVEVGDQLWVGSQILVVAREQGRWQLRHHGPDGRRVAVHDVPGEGCFIGRSADLVLDPDDTRLSRRHAQVVVEEQGLRFYDRGAHNGSYLRLRAPTRLCDGDELRISTQRIRYAELAIPAEVEGETQGGVSAGPVGEREVADSGDEERLRLGSVAHLDESAGGPAATGAPEEARVEPEAASRARSKESRPAWGLARRLRALAAEETTARVSDEGEPAPASDEEPAPASDEEPVSASDEKPARAPEAPTRSSSVPAADRTESAAPSQAGPSQSDEDTSRAGGDASPTAIEVPAPADPGSPALVEAAEPGRTGSEAGAAAGPVLIVIDAEEESFSVEGVAGQTVLEAVRDAGLERGQPIDWECNDGRCGVCVVGVVEGGDRMDPPGLDSEEMKTIQITEQVAPDPARYRLACLARVRGTVRLRKLT